MTDHHDRSPHARRTRSARGEAWLASIASRSAGPGTCANIDEFTETTARALHELGGAGRGNAIICSTRASRR